MERLTQVQLDSANKLCGIVSERISEDFKFINKLQEDFETKSALCELLFSEKRGLVWVRANGSVGSLNGTRLLLKGGKLPKKNPSLDCIFN
jgi:hypothetical protein